MRSHFLCGASQFISIHVWHVHVCDQSGDVGSPAQQVQGLLRPGLRDYLATEVFQHGSDDIQDKWVVVDQEYGLRHLNGAPSIWCQDRLGVPAAYDKNADQLKAVPSSPVDVWADGVYLQARMEDSTGRSSSLPDWGAEAS
jgi:hypothetical protein